ncbi:MAG: HEPN domain-containing protein [Solirubrobacterales bacterium]
MRDGVDALLSRASEEVAAARVLVGNDFPRQAASRAYYGAFYAAEAALLVLGETRSKHSGVISAFGRLVVKAGGLDRETGRLLSELFAERGEADYGEGMGSEEAAEAIADAERFVHAVREWIDAAT